MMLSSSIFFTRPSFSVFNCALYSLIIFLHLVACEVSVTNRMPFLEYIPFISFYLLFSTLRTFIKSTYLRTPKVSIHSDVPQTYTHLLIKFLSIFFNPVVFFNLILSQIATPTDIFGNKQNKIVLSTSLTLF